MLKRTNSFFSIGGEPPLESPRRLLGRVDQQRNGSLLVEAVDADWIEDLLGRRATPELWSEVGPEAPVSVLELGWMTWWSLLESRPRDIEARRVPRCWVEFWLGDGGEPVRQYFNLHAGPREIRVHRILTIDGARAADLSSLLDLKPYRADKGTIEAALPPDQVDWIAVYDVGQGSASALLDGSGFPCAYYDLGGGVLGHHSTFPPAFDRLCCTRRPPVILSHWDWDHWSSGGRFPQSQTLSWIVPEQKLGIVHGVFAALVAANGTLLVWPPGLARAKQGQVTLEKCTGTHRNDSGLAAFVEGPAGEPPILLPGDARYTAIPSAMTQLHSVVAPHHGAEMKAAKTPTSCGSSTSRVVYSFGDPNQWSHPRPVTQTRHDIAGWLHDPAPGAGADRHTVHRVNGLGHVGLSWSGGAPPTPPCHGMSCAQEIVQT